LLERWSRGEARFHHARYQRLPNYRLRGMRATLACLACLLPLAFGFLVPGGALFKWTVESTALAYDPYLARLALNSFTLAAIAATLSVVLALGVGYGLRLRAAPATVLAARLAGMGYAIPGAVIAVGVLVPFAWIDTRVDAWMRAGFGISTGLVLSGTIAAVVFAYVVRFFAIASHAVEAGLAKVTANMDGAARLLGLGPVGTLVQVHAPMIWVSVLTAAMLVFVDVMKELPATLIIRPFNFDTLAIRVFELVSDEQLFEASGAALGIVSVGVLPVILLSRAIARARPGHG